MAIICHVGRDEHPLWESIGVEIAVEHCEVFAFCGAVDVGCYGVVAHEGTSYVSRFTQNLEKKKREGGE